MRIKLQIVACFFFAAFLFAGCTDREDPTFLYNVDHQYSMKLIEGLGLDVREILIEVTPLDEQVCEDVRLNYFVEREGANIVLSLNGLSSGADCTLNPYIYTETVSLGVLPLSDYNLTIKIGDVITNDVILQHTAQHYNIKYDIDPEGMVFDFLQLEKIPEDVYWGNIGYSTLESGELIKSEFWKALAATGIDSEPILQEGEYGYFKVLSSGESLDDVGHQGEYDFNEFILFSSEENISPTISKTLEDIKNNFEEEPPFGFDLKSYQGESFQ